MSEELTFSEIAEQPESGSGQVALTLDDCEPNLSTAVGVNYEGEVDKYLKDFETPYPLTIKKDGQQISAGYNFKVVFKDGRKLPVQSWKLHGQLKSAFVKAKKISGALLSLEHFKAGTKDESGWDVQVLDKLTDSKESKEGKTTPSSSSSNTSVKYASKINPIIADRITKSIETFYEQNKKPMGVHDLVKEHAKLPIIAIKKTIEALYNEGKIYEAKPECYMLVDSI